MPGEKAAGRSVKERRFTLSRGFVLKMLISCILVTLIPLAVNSLLYKKQIDEKTRQEEKEIRQYLENQQARYDEYIRDLDKILRSIFSDDDLLSVSIIKNPVDNSGSMLYRFVTAQKQISLIAKPYDMLDDMIMLNMRRDVAISTQSVFMRMNTFVPAMGKKYPGYTWPGNLVEMLQSEKQQRKQWLYLPSKTSNNAISLCVNTLMMSNGNHIVLFLITPERLKSYLKTNDSTDIVIFSPDHYRLTGDPRYDLEDDKLLTVHDSAVIEGNNGERYFVQAAHSQAADHLMYAVTPYTSIKAIIDSMMYMDFFYLVILFAATLALCAVVTWVNMKPLDGILRFLFGQDAKAVSRTLNWKNIEERIHELLQKNSELTDDLSRRNEALVNSYLNALIVGRGPNTGHVLQRLEQLNIPQHAGYHVILMDIPGPVDTGDLASFSLLVHRQILSCFSDVKAVLDISSHRFLVLTRSDDSFTVVADQFGVFQENLNKMLEVSAAGCYFHMDSIEDLETHYWNAATNLEIRRESVPELFVLEDNLKTVSCFAFPQQLEQDIIFSVVAGNRQMLEDALISLNELNIQVLQEGTISSRLLWEQLAAVIAMALSRVRNIPEALHLKIILSLRRLINTDKCADFTRRIMNIMDPVFILAKQDQGTTSSRSQLTHEIIEYIQANLNNPDLCLQMISDHFSFSGAYISALVKEETGQGFAVYCERLRIANACEMLKNNAKIQDVAEAVGYNSVHSFRRAFKKVLGILPSQYPQL